MSKQPDTVDFKTIVYMFLGIIVPFWPISLPWFWYLAYRTYKKGDTPMRSLADLKEAEGLLESGTITQEQFERIKADVLGSSTAGG